MNFDQLRTFVTVVDAGGVHRAAAQLHLSQPAVCARYRALRAISASRYSTGSGDVCS